MNNEPYNIDYFINLNKSYIGGNMEYNWGYFQNKKIIFNNRNFNGGMSLRKRRDMIQIIENFPPLNTLDNRDFFLSEHEDVYFTVGCIKLNLPLGDDEPSSHFALHTIYHDSYFGIHKPNEEIKQKLSSTNFYLKYLNKYL
jgi:hypothetical protein